MDKGKTIHIENDEEQSDEVVNRDEKSNNTLLGRIVSGEEEAYNLYNAYAYMIGFSIRRGKPRYYEGTREIRLKDFYCSCEGFKDGKEDLLKDVKFKKLDARCGCQAMIRFKVENGQWQVIHHVSEHNHYLALPHERHLLRSAREITIEKANYIKDMVNSGISIISTFNYMSQAAGGPENLGFLERDCYNLVNKEKMMLIEARDAQSLINLFKVKKKQDPMFFYTEQIDQEGRLTNFFWRDGRSRIDYDAFGDVVVFDTTYRTNKYNLICAPFVGVNNHWQNVMFGCAFLLDEKTESFVWLFKSFLDAMGDQAPKTIFTDQDQAMSNAIEKVFPRTSHRLCLWQISKNALGNLGPLKSNNEFMSKFNKCLYGCESENEFQSEWDEMISKFECSNHTWLKKLYNLRYKWCTGLSKETFSADILSTQRSESTNNVLGGLAKSTTSLTNFVLAFDNLLKRWRASESRSQFESNRGTPNIIVNESALLRHAARIYTVTMFKKFQSEYVNVLASTWSTISQNTTIHTYEVKSQGSSKKVRTIYFDSSSLSVSCSCKKFESMGILCSHALTVLVLNKVEHIPNQYILPRWTKQAKDNGIASSCGVSHDVSLPCSETLFCNRMLRYVYNLILKGKESQQTRSICENGFKKIHADVEKELANLWLHDNINDDVRNDVGDQEDVFEVTPLKNPPTKRPK